MSTLPTHRKPTFGRTAALGARDHGGGTVNLLLVDDKPENLTALSAVLERPDYCLIQASSGSEALKQLLTHDFAAVLLDVLMPGMDGFELASLIKDRERTRNVPILFLTAVAADISRVYRGYSTGAVDYLTKPIDAEVVRAKVAVFVELYRKNEQIKRQAEMLRELEQREQEQRLSELRSASERSYRHLAEAIPHIVWTARRDGTITYFNERWRDYAGRPPGELAGWDWLGVVHPEDREALLARWQEAIRLRESFSGLHRLRHAGDGAYRWHLLRAVPELDEEDRIVAWLGTFTDVDEQQRLQRHASFLADVGTALVASLGRASPADDATIAYPGTVSSALRSTVEEVARLCVPTLGDVATVELLDDAGGIAQAATAGAAHRLEALERVPSATTEVPILDEQRRSGLRAGVIVPLSVRGRPIGALRLYATSDAPFEGDLAEQYALRAALAIDNARRFEAALKK